MSLTEKTIGSSFRDAPLGADPESILPAVVMDSGLAREELAPRNDITKPVTQRRRKAYLYSRSLHHGKYDGMSDDTLSLNCAGRFSRNDMTPSLTSSERPRA